jgi:23S rRNA (adenine1618-N6)-methyltransferase
MQPCQDIDPDNLKHAERNVRLNDLGSRVQVLPRKSTDPLVPLDELKLDRIDFVMTNPPFYESEEEMARSAGIKERPPNSACTGAPVEMVCAGGEVAFVSRILDESLRLKQRVQWYSCMFGMVSSLESMVDKLREHRVDNYAVTEFVQGRKTRRWAVAWSFGPMRPSQPVCRGMKSTPWRKILPTAVEVELFSFQEAGEVGKMADKLSMLVGSLQLLSWLWDREKLTGTGRARENVWSRAWRRKRKREEEVEATMTTQDSGGKEHCALGFSVSLSVQNTGAVVSCRWREGHDQSIFTSFCGFIKTRLQADSTSQTRD